MLKYVIPVYLLTIFFFFCRDNVPGEDGYANQIANSPVALASILFIAIVLAFLMVLVHVAGRRWDAEGRFDNLPDDD